MKPRLMRWLGLLALAALLIHGSVPFATTVQAAGTNTKFLTHLGFALLARPLTSYEQNVFLNLLNQSAARPAVAQIMLNSTEYRKKLVLAFYQQFLQRPADAAGLAAFTEQLARGARDEQVMAGILGSAEYYDRAGATPESFLTDLYQDLLGRRPDPVGLAYFGGLLANGASRQAVAQAMLASAEYRTKLVKDLYADYLNRPPSAAEIAPLVALLMHGATIEQLRALLLGSNEYFDGEHFDLLLQDDQQRALLRIDAATGRYEFKKCAGGQASGLGNIQFGECQVTLVDREAGRYLYASVNTCAQTGNAAINVGRVTLTMGDSNLGDNSGACLIGLL